MTGQSTKKNGRVSGFTLVEIMIAILILGLALSTVYVSYSYTMKMVHDIEYEDQLYKMARTTMDRIIKDLSSLQLSSGAFDFHADKQTLGNREFYSLSFWSASHLAFGESEGEGYPVAISYYVQEDESGESFSLRRSDLTSAKPSKNKSVGSGFVVCQNVDTFSLRFYDSTGSELESWDSSSFSDPQKGNAPISRKNRSGLGQFK